MAVERRPMQPERAEEVRGDEDQGHQSEHTTEPGQPGLPQLVFDGFGGIHEASYARLTDDAQRDAGKR
jgi:hypothetical protein